MTTDTAGRTSVPGIWAVGNVGDSRALVISAAAFALNHDLVDTEVEESITEPSRNGRHWQNWPSPQRARATWRRGGPDPFGGIEDSEALWSHRA